MCFVGILIVYFLNNLSPWKLFKTRKFILVYLLCPIAFVIIITHWRGVCFIHIYFYVHFTPKQLDMLKKL